MAREMRVYLVTGIVPGYPSAEFIEARSWREACYRFCRERGLSMEDDVPLLGAESVDCPDDKGMAVNGGFLDE